MIRARIEAAVSAVASARGVTLDTRHMTLVGYSEGALRAESLAKRYPHDFPWLVLGGDPHEPPVDALLPVRAVAMLAGARDAQETMRKGAKARAAAGGITKFFELPDAAHGHYGPEAEAVMNGVLTWLKTAAPGP